MRIIYCLRWQKKSLLIIVSQKESVLLYYEMIIDLYEAVLLLGNMIDEQRGWYLKSISINITSIHVIGSKLHLVNLFHGTLLIVIVAVKSWEVIHIIIIVIISIVINT